MNTRQTHSFSEFLHHHGHELHQVQQLQRHTLSSLGFQRRFKERSLSGERNEPTGVEPKGRKPEKNLIGHEKQSSDVSW